MNIHSGGLQFNCPLVGNVISIRVAMIRNCLHAMFPHVQGNELAADRGLNSSLAVTSDNIYSHVSNIPVGAYASDLADETSAHFPEATSSNGAGQSLMNANARQGFDEPRTSGEIVPVPLDDILIHEDDPQPVGADVETAEEVPFTDAPIVGAPFRLISFVARYVSGADLVNQK